MRRVITNGIGLILTWAIWLWLAGASLSGLAYILIAVIGMLAAIPVVLAGRRVLDSEPTVEKAHEVTTYVHYLLGILFGSAIIAAVRYSMSLPEQPLPAARWAGVALMFLSSVAFLLVLVNLALKGLGGPFAAALTRMVATEWFYAWTRNPMILAGLALLLGIGLYYQSALLILWLLVVVIPTMMVFVRVYEERELEIRFGQSYLDYKSKTPRFIPKRP